MDYKKMIAAIAVAATSAAMAEISSSVVGYNKATAEADATIYRVATFEGIGSSGATFTLSQLSVGNEDFAWYNGDYIATVDPYGAQDTYYTWDPDTQHWCETDDSIGPTDNYADDVELPLNQGVIIYSLNGVDLTVSGAVLAGDTELYSVADATTYTGNFTPTTLTLGDIVVGTEDFAWYNGDYIATIDAYGAQETYYTWNDDGDGFWCVTDDSIGPTDDNANDVEFEPNMGFLFYSLSGATLNIPSPL